MRNAAGNGCHEPNDDGLSQFGRAVVKEMNALGMVVDASHTGYRTTMDILEASTAPVIFSHSNPATLQAHPRNIADDQIAACAQSGGVIGVVGFDGFLPGRKAKVSALIEAIDYLVEVAGIDHVGLGLDWIYCEACSDRLFRRTRPPILPAKVAITRQRRSFSAPRYCHRSPTLCWRADTNIPTFAGFWAKLAARRTSGMEIAGESEAHMTIGPTTGLALKIAATLFVSALLAIGSALLFTSPWWIQLPIKSGAWRASARMGNAGDSMYLRAYTARIAWFSNDPDANVYYEARQDSDGAKLDARCSYDIAGTPLPARWWSVTAYANAHWIANAINRYSFAKTDIRFLPSGSWIIRVGPQAREGNWLPTDSSKSNISFILRLYDLAPGMAAKAATLHVPEIKRVSCP